MIWSNVQNVNKEVAESAWLISLRDLAKAMLIKENLNVLFAIRLRKWINQIKFWQIFSNTWDSYALTTAKKHSPSERCFHINLKENATKDSRDRLIHQEVNNNYSQHNNHSLWAKFLSNNHLLLCKCKCLHHNLQVLVVDIVILGHQWIWSIYFKKILRHYIPLTLWIRLPKLQDWGIKHRSHITSNVSMDQRDNCTWLVVVTIKRMKTLFILSLKSRPIMTLLSSRETLWSIQDMVIQLAGLETSLLLSQDQEKRRINLK